MKLEISKSSNPNYLATICKVTNLTPIPNSDNLLKSTINGYDMIISKDTCIGDIVVYFPCESKISEKYLSSNNLYCQSDCELNANYSEVKKLMDENNNTANLTIIEENLRKIRSMCGFFSKNNRVRVVKLRGEYSEGFIAPVSSLELAYPTAAGTDWNNYVGTQFDIIDGNLIVEKYLPYKAVQESSKNSRFNKNMKKLKKFDRIIPGTFSFHYDTRMLAEHVDEINPNDTISISVKIHGTSAVFAKVPVKRELTLKEKIKKFFGLEVNDIEIGEVYSSHSVIKNKYINKDAKPGFYGEDVWGVVAKYIFPCMNDYMTVYGEICGYMPNSATFIQKNHDYGCRTGEWKFMPYRITTLMANGEFFEWDLDNVRDWTLRMIDEHPDLKDRLMPPTILYIGQAKSVFSDIPVDDNWRANFLNALKTSYDWIGMEKNEPLCKNKVPREGIVIRIVHDKFPRAWKLKSKAHYALATKMHDNNEVDIEEQS